MVILVQKGEKGRARLGGERAARHLLIDARFDSETARAGLRRRVLCVLQNSADDSTVVTRVCFCLSSEYTAPMSNHSSPPRSSSTTFKRLAYRVLVAVVLLKPGRELRVFHLHEAKINSP